MSGINTQTGNTKEVSITVVRDDYGDWNLQGEVPVEVKLDSSTGTVFIPGGKAAPGSIAKSISENTEVNAKAGESEIGISLLSMDDIDDAILDLIAQNVTASEFQKHFGPPENGKEPTGSKTSSDSEPLIIETKDNGTIIIPPKDPRIRTFVIRYVHYDGTTRDYVLHRTVQGWDNKSHDGCSPKSNGKIVVLDPSCTRPDTVVPTPIYPASIGGSGGGGVGYGDDEPETATCQLNPATGQMEIYDPVGDYGLSRRADGSIGPGRDIPKGANYQEYINSRKGFTGILCTNKDLKPKYPVVPKAEVAGPTTRVETIIRTETSYVTHDNSRTVEVMNDSDLIIRIPDTEYRPVVTATLRFEHEDTRIITINDETGETRTEVNVTPVQIVVERKSGKYVPTKTIPGFVNFNDITGVFKIPADKILPNTEVRLDFTTMVKVDDKGGIYGAVKEAGGEMVLFGETFKFNMNKENLGDIEAGFVLLPPDIAEYSTHFVILTPKDTGTVTVEVAVYDENDNLIIKGDSVLAPLGTGWVTNGDKNGMLSGNPYSGTMMLQREIFKGKAGKIVATSYDASNTLSKTVTLEVSNNPENLAKLKDLPSGLITQPEKPYMESINGTVTIEYLDKDNSHSGEITFVSAETNESLTYRWQRNAEWESTFQLVSGTSSARVNKQIRVNKTPNLKFVIPHWLIRNDTEVTATVNGNPEKPEEWVSVSRSIISERPTDEEPMTAMQFKFDEESTVFQIKPTGKAFTINITYTKPNGEEVNMVLADTSLGIGEPAWSQVDNTFEPIVNADENIDINPQTGEVTIRDSLNVIDPFKDIVVVQGAIDPEVTPLRQTRQIAHKPARIEDIKSTLEPITEPLDDVITLTGNNEGIIVTHAPDNRFTSEFVSQAVAVELEDEEIMHLHFTKREGKWVASRLTSLNDNVLPLTLVHSVKGDNISMSQYGLIMAVLKRKDINSATKVKVKYLAINTNDKYVYLERMQDVSPERMVGNEMPMNPKIGISNPDSRMRESLQRGALGITQTQSYPNETVRLRNAVTPFLPLNKRAMTDFQRTSIYSSSQQSNSFDPASNIGIIGANAFNYTDGRTTINMPHEFMLKPTQREDGTYDPFVIAGGQYTETSREAINLRQPVMEGGELSKLYGMDKAVFAFRDKNGNMQLLALRLERQRLKVKDSPVAYHFYNAESDTVTIAGKTYRHEKAMLTAPASLHERILADEYNETSSTPKQVVMARKFNKEFGDLYLDELVDDEKLKYMLARFTWVEDAETTPDKAKLFRYGTANESRTGFIGRSAVEAVYGNNSQTNYHVWFQQPMIKTGESIRNLGSTYYGYLAQVPGSANNRKVSSSQYLLDTSVYNTHLKTMDFTDGEQKLKVNIGLYTDRIHPRQGDSMSSYYGKVRLRGEGEVGTTDYINNGITNNADVFFNFSNYNQAWYKYDTDTTYSMIDPLERIYINLLEAKRNTTLTDAYKTWVSGGVGEPVEEETTRIYVLTHHMGGWLFEAFDYFLNESPYDTEREMKTNYGFNV